MTRLGIFCNCPDASAIKDANPSARYLSNLSDSNWSEGFNGIRANEGYCIHELAVLRIRGEMAYAFPGGIPRDYAIEPLKIAATKYKANLQKNRLLGDNVGF